MLLEKILPVLERYNVHTCYLFGSRATGGAGPDSDVDLAVLFFPYDPTVHNLDLQVEMEAALSRTLHPLKVDLVFLQKEKITFRFEVISSGKVIYCRDHDERTDFEDIVVRDYLDFAPFLNRYYREMLEAIEGGEFFAE
ncbi:type VII toxin-antitoxin system MntA family adenylyltransferase antitoxin [Calderihabitans maritimus]|uniref:Polymerase beta nucleotidyltransferase domain-containing protein n=1 Tax=Calderihabitans maritimus TaxID=1246530 RepID=A0A1Z5HUX3_9FIRM|nr:nucleotidyltransferase domain-containing protein [Calderihabitans maritimus]GAW93090.1 hypothetical protein Tph_c00810 [Calderihabitans maritimus]